MVSATWIEGKRKYLLCADHLGVRILQPILEILMNKNVPYEHVIIDMDQSLTMESIPNWLSDQKMGCFLYFAGTWDKVEEIKQHIESVGLCEQEYQLIGTGDKIRRVFCCRCHTINRILTEFEYVSCAACGLRLSISDHYSRLHRAYLGYVAEY